jgi:hypothetical protein
MEYVDLDTIQPGLRFCFNPNGPVYRVTGVGSLPSTRPGHSTYETVSYVNESDPSDSTTDNDLDVLYDAMVVH